MADEVMRSSTETSAIVPEVWSQMYYDALLANLPFNAVISKDWEGEIQALGDTVNISSFPEFDEGSELAEDARADSEAVTVSGQQLVINYRIVKDFTLTKKSIRQSLPAMMKLRELAIYSIMKKIQSLIISLSIPSASAPDHSIAYDTGSTLVLADALEAKELLDAQDVPLSNRHFVVGAAQLNDIFAIANFTSSDYVAGNTPLLSGGLPAQLLGFTPHFTSVVGNTSYWFHASYMTIAAQEGMNVTQYDLGVDGKRADRVNCDSLVGIKMLDNTRIVTIG